MSESPRLSYRLYNLAESIEQLERTSDRTGEGIHGYIWDHVDGDELIGIISKLKETYGCLLSICDSCEADQQPTIMYCISQLRKGEFNKFTKSLGGVPYGTHHTYSLAVTPGNIDVGLFYDVEDAKLAVSKLRDPSSVGIFPVVVVAASKPVTKDIRDP